MVNLADAPHTVGIPLQVQTDPFGVHIECYGGHNMPPHDFAGYESPGDERWGAPVRATRVVWDEATTIASLPLAVIDRMINEYARGVWVTASRAHLWGARDIGTTA